MTRLSLLALCILVAACSSSPVNAAGTYTIAVTNRDNGCNIQNWTVGQSSTGITAAVTQQNATATAMVTGLGSALALDALLGSNSFTGTVDGDTLNLSITGTHAQQSGNCTYTYNAKLKATLNGDTLTGTIDYTAATNGNSDCASLQGCVSYQDFNGSRPPA